jgi:hypothetical protein
LVQTGLRGLGVSRSPMKSDRFDPVCRDEADSSDKDLPTTRFGPKVSRIVRSRRARIREVGQKKNNHLLVVPSTPTRGFTAAVSVFGSSTSRWRAAAKRVWGTPPPKPLNCKVWEIPVGASANHARSRSRPTWALFFPSSTSIVSPFVGCSVRIVSEKQKTLLTSR